MNFGGANYFLCFFEGITTMKTTVASFAAMKASGEKISMLTAYDYSTARMIDAAGVNAILVGDSLGNVILGYGSTIPVTVDDMIHHGAAVVRGAAEALVVVDMPFMSYQVSVEEALSNAGRIIKETRCAALKLEGGKEIAPVVRRLTEAGIPVMGHVGMMPQHVNVYGGFKVQGKDAAAAERILEDAKAIEEAGAFAVVLECVPAHVAAKATAMLCIPTIGIGAGPECDGQVLVNQDMTGMFSDFKPRFVRRFCDAGSLMREAYRQFDAAVKAGDFPNEAETPVR